jgi:glycosyltransferase involved in cell wall biosynthesis
VWDEEIFLDLTVHFPWDHIIAVSHFIKREIAGCGFDDARITVVHHGIDTGMFRRRTDIEPLYGKYPRLKGKRVMFHPARISLGKGAMTSIKAAGIVRKNIDNVLLVLAGSGNIIDWDAHMDGDMKYISALVRALGLEDNIHIDSFSIEQMAELYNLSEVCVYPSSAQEPFGLTMLEAQASEKAIVVTRAGGMAEIIHDGINGYVVPVRHHEDLAHRVLTLMNDAGLRQRLGTVGRTNVLTHFTKEIMAAATLDVYRAVLNTTK